MLVKIYPENPNLREIQKVVEVLRNGGIVIYPTDTVYGIGCDINNAKAVDRVARFKQVKIEKAAFSFICHDLGNISEYCKPIPNSVFKIMRKNLPGPFTFILKSNNQVPKIFRNKKKTVGIRVPDNDIVREIVQLLGNPIMSTSLREDDDILEYITDPELIHEKYCNQVDLVIDGGPGHVEASTIVDCTGPTPEIIRQGLGDLVI